MEHRPLGKSGLLVSNLCLGTMIFGEENSRGTDQESATRIIHKFLDAGGNPEFELVTQRMAAIVGARGQDWHLLTAGAFVSMVLPLAVFFGLQRYFLRGLLAGSVKG